MAKYKALTVSELLEVIQTKDVTTGEEKKLKDIIEDNYNDVLEYLHLTGKGGEVNIKLKIKQEERGKVIVDIDVTKKKNKIKNIIELEQDENGKVFLDNPDQTVLPGVLPVGTTENSEENKTNKPKK